jgi:hypothetical protein
MELVMHGKKTGTIIYLVVVVSMLVLASGPAKADLILPGDADLDGYVYGTDYIIWADNYRRTDALPWSQGGWAMGNFNEDTVVDSADYTLWADNYTGAPPVLPEGHVPAPAAVTLGLVGLALIGWRMRRYA